MTTLHGIALEKHRTNFAKLQYALGHIGCNILRGFCENRVARYAIKEKCSKIFKRLSQNDQEVVNKSTLHGFKYFSIDLLYTLFKESIIEIQKPSKGWDPIELPTAGDYTVGDDVKRIMHIHFSIAKYAQYKSLRDEVFDSLWKVLDAVAKRFDVSGKTEFRHELKRIKSGDQRGRKENGDNGTVEIFRRQLTHDSRKPTFVRSSGQVYSPGLTNNGYSANNMVETDNVTGPQSSETKQRAHMQTQNVKSNPRIMPFKVYLDFPPLELNNYDFIRTELSIIVEEIKDMLDVPIQLDATDFLIFHNSKEGASKFCLKFFKSTPTIHEIKWSELKLKSKPLRKDNMKCTSKAVIPLKCPTMMCIVDSSLDFQALCKYLEPIANNVKDHQKVTFLFSSKDKVKDKKHLADRMGRLLMSSSVIKESRLWHIKDPGAKDAIFSSCYEHLSNDIEYLMKVLSSKITEESNNKLWSINQHLEQLNKECSLSFVNQNGSLPEEVHVKLTNELGVRVFAVENDTLQIYVTEPHLERVKRKYQDENLFTKVNYILFEENNVHITPYTKPGNHLFLSENDNGHYGTIGMFGKLKGSGTVVAITGAHVIAHDQRAFVKIKDNALNQELGTCIFSPRNDSMIVNVTDIAVIRVKSAVSMNINQVLHGAKVQIYSDDRARLFRQRVFKFGATTNETQGFITRPDMELKIGEQWVHVLLVNGLGSSIFSQSGDSGSIVFMKQMNVYVAVAVVFGGELNLPKVDPNATVVVSFQEAIAKFNLRHPENILQIDRF